MVNISPRLIPHPANETGVLPNKGKGGWFIEDIIWGGRVYIGDGDHLVKLRNMIYGPGPKRDDQDPDPGQIYAQEIDVMRTQYIVPLLEVAAVREAELEASLQAKGKIR